MRRQSRVSSLALGVVLALSPGVADAQEPPSPTAAAIDNAIHFRQEFGLNSDLAHVRSVEAGEDAHQVGYPVPMTADERAAWDRRAQVEAGLEPLLAYGEARPDEFGGLWVDQAAGGIVDVGFVGNAEAHRAAIEALSPEGATLRLHAVANTVGALEALQVAIGDDVDFQKALDIEVQLTYVSVSENRVVVGVSDVRDEVVKAFADRYGEGSVRLFAGGTGEPTGCTSRANCPGPPLRGGISGSYSCSMAYYAVQDNDYRMLTAGHCAGLFASWSQNGYVAMGSVVSNSFHQESTADAATIAGTETRARKSNWVYYSASTHTAIQYVQSSTQDYQGQTVCLSARMKDPVRCGQIRSTNARVQLSGVWLNQQRIASYDWVGGDSGGATYNVGLVTAFGIQSGCLDVTGDKVCDRYWATYSHIGRVIAELGGSPYIRVYTGG